MLWEVLPHALEVEDEDGLVCIQAALNDPAHANMLVHEMQIIKQMSRACMSECNKAGEVSVQAVRARLRAEGSALAETAAFLPLLQFVLEQGGVGMNAFVDPLVDFHHLFVNPRVRRLRESHFRVVCGVPQPRLRLALLKAAYGCPVSAIRDGWIDYFGQNAIIRLTSKRVDVLLLADEMSSRFHKDFADAGAWSSLGSQRPLHVFDIELGRILLGREGYLCTCEEVRIAATNFDHTVRAEAPAALAALLPPPLPDLEHSKSASTSRTSLQPKIVRYGGDAVAITENGPESCAVVASYVAWDHGVQDEAVLLQVAKSRVLISLSLLGMHATLPLAEDIHVHVADRVPTLRARRSFAERSIVLVPMVPGHAQIVMASVHPHRVPVRVGERVLYLPPCWKATWTNPFWAARRCSDKQQCNSALAEVRDSIVHSLASVERTRPKAMRHITSEDVLVHVLVNTSEIREGDEIVLFTAKRDPAVEVKASQGKRSRTWIDEARKSEYSCPAKAKRS